MIAMLQLLSPPLSIGEFSKRHFKDKEVSIIMAHILRKNINKHMNYGCIEDNWDKRSGACNKCAYWSKCFKAIERSKEYGNLRST